MTKTLNSPFAQAAAGLELDRRDVLTLALKAALLGTTGSLVACGGGDDNADAVTSAPAETPFDVWRQLQAAMRTSSDHSVGRAAALVEEGSLEGMQQFVRDEIRLISSDDNDLSLVPVAPFGPRAALRAGAGTAIEKAYILAELYTKAGYTAEVVGSRPDRSVIGPEVFFRDYTRPFDPQISSAQRDQWARVLDIPENDNPVTVG